MDAQFKVGDIVELNSGSDVMTVQSIEGDLIECIWFDGQNKRQTNKFKAATLKRAESGGSIRFVPEE